ncbi:hypothetical protein BWG23_13830 [Flavobacterium oreochromis]|nr:hypothetical protein BWG23_13830 [Flavobacterium oreochromis]
MQDSFIDLIKILLPEIIVDYFELISFKKGEEILYLYLREIKDQYQKLWGNIKIAIFAFLKST